MRPADTVDEEEFEYWLENQLGDDSKAWELYEFHGYLREDGIATGTRLGYQRKIRRELDEDGYFEEYDEAFDEDADSALKKYAEFLENRDTDNLTEDLLEGGPE